MVSLTSLLVLVSLFSQTSTNIPKTSYLKFVDSWFLAVIVLDFWVIFITVLIEYLRLKTKNKVHTHIRKFSGDILQVKPSNSCNSQMKRKLSSRVICKAWNCVGAKNKEVTIFLNELSKFMMPVIFVIVISIFSYHGASNIMSDEY